MGPRTRWLPLPQGEGWGEGIKQHNGLNLYPLILAFSRREKERFFIIV
jgi:hypothetical protein